MVLFIKAYLDKGKELRGMVGKVDLKDIFPFIDRFSPQVEKDVHTMCPPTSRRPGTAPCVCRTWQDIREILGRVGPAEEEELVLETEIVFDEVLESVGGKGESFRRTVFFAYLPDDPV